MNSKLALSNDFLQPEKHFLSQTSADRERLDRAELQRTTMVRLTSEPLVDQSFTPSPELPSLLSRDTIS